MILYTSGRPLRPQAKKEKDREVAKVRLLCSRTAAKLAGPKVQLSLALQAPEVSKLPRTV